MIDMSSGSYFTIYRKHTDKLVDGSVIEFVKHEYYLSNKNGLSNDKDDDNLKKDMPLLMCAGHKANHEYDPEGNKLNIYYDANGYAYDKLLEFHFCSTFTCLKEHFHLNPYKFSEQSIFISRCEAEKMLQAIEYLLSECYDKTFERILNNEYVSLFGDGYSPYDNRFKSHKDPIYIDKDGENYTLSFRDYCSDREVEESDNDVRFNLNRTKACLLAFLNAEENSYDNEELILEYSAY